MSTDIPPGWTSAPFVDLIVSPPRSLAPTTPRSSYRDQGRFPVVDQGQEFVAGFTDDEALIYRGGLPVIVFGDHTRQWKYVDFPFVVGADGTQLLRPSSSALDSKFLYYALSAVPLANLGYSRHFKLLKEATVRYPLSLPEQRKIAAILSSLDEVIERMEAEAAQVRVVASIFLGRVFETDLAGKENVVPGAPIRHGAFSWEVVPLDECVDRDRPICYGILMPGRGFSGGIPVVKVKNIRDGRIDTRDLLLTSPEIEARYRRSRLKAGDVLLTIRGTTGRLAVVPPELEGANITQDTARVAVRKGVASDYIYTVLQSPDLQRQIREHTRGQAVKGINIGDVRRLRLPLPSYKEQKMIATTARSFAECREAMAANLNALRTLKRALASHLLSGEIRVIPEGVAA
jgi:type I restriction enzyme, S subunit